MQATARLDPIRMPPSDAVRRGTRVPLRVPVAYRQEAGEQWRSAATVNFSRSGALLELESDALESHRTLEFVIQLSAGGSLVEMTDVRCRGRIVRVDRTGAGVRVAVTIDAFQYAPGVSLFRLDAQ